MENNIDLPKVKLFSEFEFDDNIGLEGAIYPRPGGLMKNLSKESLLENAYCGYKFIF